MSVTGSPLNKEGVGAERIWMAINNQVPTHMHTQLVFTATMLTTGQNTPPYPTKTSTNKQKGYHSCFNKVGKSCIVLDVVFSAARNQGIVGVCVWTKNDSAPLKGTYSMPRRPASGTRTQKGAAVLSGSQASKIAQPGGVRAFGVQSG